jgi:hypothetical protein
MGLADKRNILYHTLPPSLVCLVILTSGVPGHRIGLNISNTKYQIPNPKSQTNFNLQFPMTERGLFWILVISAYLEFDA